MTGSTYTCSRWLDLQSQYIKPNAIGITGTATAGQTTIKDYALTDDVFIRGIEVLTDGSAFGDSITIQVLDSNNLMGYGAGAVVSTPVSNWNISPTKSFLSYEAIVPQKGLATFTVRVNYTSVGETDVAFGINFLFLKILV